jgi:uncharacterized coiled-coil DUF342 family protein
MNPRLEIYTQLMAGMLSNSALVDKSYRQLHDEVMEATNTIIKEIGEESSVCELSIIESNAALVERINHDSLEKHMMTKCSTRSIASEHVSAMEFQLKQEIQARMRAEDELAQVKQKGDPLQTGLGPQLNAALSRLDEYRGCCDGLQCELEKSRIAEAKLSDELRNLRSSCQKLVEEWRHKGWYCATELEAVLKGGTK